MSTYSEKPQRIWKKVAFDEVLDLHKEGRGKGGVAVSVHVSPYDVPERVEGYQKEGEGSFRIKFHYLDDDEPEQKAVSERLITVYLGKHSRRISSIEIDVEKAGADWIALVLKTLDSLKSAEAPDLNLKATHKAFEDFAGEVPLTLLHSPSNQKARSL